MPTIQTNYLSLSLAISRGANTYGYNIVRLDSRTTGQRYKCMGGGYDMQGTCLGQWLKAEYADRVNALFTGGPEWKPYGSGGFALQHENKFYGAFWQIKESRMILDGACGVESMTRIAEAIGLSVTRTGDKRGRTTGFMVTDYGDAETRKAMLGNLA